LNAISSQRLDAVGGHVHRSPVSMLAVFTASLWLVFAAAGVTGLRIRYPGAMLVSKARPPVTVERLNVNVVKSEPRGLPKTEITQNREVPQPQPLAASPMPSLLPVADSKLDIPFPLAVKGPSRLTEASKAVPAPVQATPAAAKTSSVEHLTFGEGEGDQPAPEYPREAKLAHEEGNVIVQMTIGENGDVTDATVTSPCPWPILNQAALRAVRDTWHFARGNLRYKDIEFVFELHQR
jgi:TonB family protein